MNNFRIPFYKSVRVAARDALPTGCCSESVFHSGLGSTFSLSERSGKRVVLGLVPTAADGQHKKHKMSPIPPSCVLSRMFTARSIRRNLR